MNRYKLPYRPILQQDESAASLLIRTAEGNGFENVLQLMSACGFKHGGASTLKAVVTDQTRYAELMNALGLNVDYASSAFLRSKPTRAHLAFLCMRRYLKNFSAWTHQFFALFV
jgi:hypothetical protein